MGNRARHRSERNQERGDMGGTRKRVMWVDDEIEFLRAHIMFLETRGYSVIPVFSGDDAIHMIKDTPDNFDIVLLDEQMPGKDGLATLDEIKTINPDLPVVMVTKSEEEKVMEDAIGKKIDGYLTKPVNPSQILMVCKKIIDSEEIISSQISQKFIRSYSQLKTTLSGTLDASKWIRFYEHLVRWDLELEKVKDEGLRQTQAGLKSDANAHFSEYVVENYGSWCRGQGNPPDLSVNVVEKYVKPLVAEGKNVCLVVLDCMRLDQYLAIESLLRSMYSVDRKYYYSIVPTSTAFARNALFSGKYPEELVAESPELYAEIDEETEEHNAGEGRLLAENLRSTGLELSEEPEIVPILSSSDAKDFLESMGDCCKAPLTTLLVNFVDLLSHHRSTSNILKEIAPDEAAFRALTKSWFEHSNVLQILQKLAKRDCTVILTTDHGSVFCTRATEIYGAKGIPKNMRYKFGEKVTVDERHALFLADPMAYRLPRKTEATNCIIGRENYYFVDPGKFEDYQQQYQNTFQHGGVSLEEVIVPLAVLTPRNG